MKVFPTNQGGTLTYINYRSKHSRIILFRHEFWFLSFLSSLIVLSFLLFFIVFIVFFYRFLSTQAFSCMSNYETIFLPIAWKTSSSTINSTVNRKQTTVNRKESRWFSRRRFVWWKQATFGPSPRFYCVRWGRRDFCRAYWASRISRDIDFRWRSLWSKECRRWRLIS